MNYSTAISKYQTDYSNLLARYQDSIAGPDFSFRNAGIMMDEIRCFWLERLEIIDYELAKLTGANADCFLLSGAIYLNISAYEHYYFKTLGSYHFLQDPLLKMDNFIRLPPDQGNAEGTLNYLRRVFNDTTTLLTKHNDAFHVLPIRELAIANESKHEEFLKASFLKVLSGAFRTEIASEQEFCNKYPTFESIEEGMSKSVRSLFVFSSEDLEQESLRSRIEMFETGDLNPTRLLRSKTEPERFILAAFSRITQIFDILTICLVLKLNPYIRHPLTFHYLGMLMENFQHDENLMRAMENAIIFFVLRRTVEPDQFKQFTFAEYQTILKDKQLLARIAAAMRDKGIDIVQQTSQASTIIVDEFSATLSL